MNDFFVAADPVGPERFTHIAVDVNNKFLHDIGNLS
jgi:hypothetical protein